MSIPKHAETLAWFLYTGIAERPEALAETATALRTDVAVPDGMNRVEFATFVAALTHDWDATAQSAAERMAADAEQDKSAEEEAEA